MDLLNRYKKLNVFDFLLVTYFCFIYLIFYSERRRRLKIRTSKIKRKGKSVYKLIQIEKNKCNSKIEKKLSAIKYLLFRKLL